MRTQRADRTQKVQTQAAGYCTPKYAKVNYKDNFAPRCLAKNMWHKKSLRLNILRRNSRAKIINSKMFLRQNNLQKYLCQDVQLKVFGAKSLK